MSEDDGNGVLTARLIISLVKQESFRSYVIMAENSIGSTDKEIKLEKIIHPSAKSHVGGHDSSSNAHYTPHTKARHNHNHHHNATLNRYINYNNHNSDHAVDSSRISLKMRSSSSSLANSRDENTTPSLEHCLPAELNSSVRTNYDLSLNGLSEINLIITNHERCNEYSAGPRFDLSLTSGLVELWFNNLTIRPNFLFDY
ncbi:hypothetical protein HELRODRAFT_174024 [Helobdella robusta]|uniref:Uncharacterized protein n=1 Tax=Helobdella robusta TaxID=6412 RepID=T1F7H9_HELRO|nr:hypothetical protein HELRODRAFT_174024 [Helobdella robusta]ESO03132.1 hypothetical protein HELRODRAFT_174024 [Helobdella robusta]